MTFSEHFILFVFALAVAAQPPRIHAEQESLDTQHTRLENMTPAQKEELRLKRDRFDRLSKVEKQNLRRMHEHICCDPKSENLREIMIRYNDWLISLPSSQRSKLLNMSADERIATIKTIVEEQEKKRFSELVKRALRPEDYEVLIRWFEDLVRVRLPAEVQTQISHIGDGRRRRFEMFRLYRQHAGDKSLFEADPPTPEEIQLLTDQLSSQAREALSKAENAESYNRILREWIGAGFYSMFRPSVSQEELQHFLVNQVDAKQREYLENLPREAMLMELRRLHGMSRIQRTFGESGRWPFRKRRPGDFHVPKGRPFKPENSPTEKPPRERS